MDDPLSLSWYRKKRKEERKIKEAICVSRLFKTTLGASGSHYKIVVKLEEKRGEQEGVANVGRKSTNDVIVNVYKGGEVKE